MTDPLHQSSPPGATWSTTNFAEALPGVPTPLTWSIWQPVMEHAARWSWQRLGVISATEEVPAVTGIFFGHVAGRVDAMASVVARLPGMDPDAFAEQLFGVPRGHLAVDRTRSRWLAIAAHAPVAVATVSRQLARLRADTEAWWRRTVTSAPADPLDQLIEGTVRFAHAMAVHTLASHLSQALYEAAVKIDLGRAPRVVTGTEVAELDTARDLWSLAHDQLDLEAFLARHGYHGPNEGELASPSWREDPAPVLAAASYYRSSGTDPGDRLARQRADRDAALAELRDSLPLHAWVRARPVLALAGRVVPWRESGKSAFLQVLDGCRFLARLLCDSDEIFYFTLDELRTGQRPDIAERRAVRARYATIQLPSLWTGDPTPVLHVERAVPDGLVRGAPAAAGIAEGRARVVLDPADCAVPLDDDEVLVTRTTDPSWVVMILSAAALVIDVGGPMSHGAIVARDLGIPCVIGTGDGTARIPPGAKVRVDGTAGTIELI